MKAQKHTLLIVDDDEDERLLAKSIFEASGTEYKLRFRVKGS
jgi:CheY-like chemotaxis protein